MSCVDVRAGEEDTSSVSTGVPSERVVVLAVFVGVMLGEMSPGVGATQAHDRSGQRGGEGRTNPVSVGEVALAVVLAASGVGAGQVGVGTVGATPALDKSG